MAKQEIQFNLRIPKELKEQVEISAKQNNRSINAEATSRLENSFVINHIDIHESIKLLEDFFVKHKASNRKNTIAQRLKQSINTINTISPTAITPAHIAKEIGENYAEPMENFIEGLEEPSFTQLEKIAMYLNVNPKWLQFGDQNIFAVIEKRLIGDIEENISWLLDKNLNSQLSSLYFVRNQSSTGELIIIKKYDQWRCNTFITPYRLSNRISALDKENLIRLFHIWKHLSLDVTNNIIIRSYILEPNDFDMLKTGVIHPLLKLNNITEYKWWQDIWSKHYSQEQNYWDGWDSLCEQIHQNS